MKATKRTKTTAKKSKGMKRGKSLESVKPLTKIAAGPATTSPSETISLPYGKIEWKYSQQ
jgi:type VI protein secretion system component Hcp